MVIPLQLKIISFKVQSLTAKKKRNALFKNLEKIFLKISIITIIKKATIDKII